MKILIDRISAIREIDPNDDPKEISTGTSLSERQKNGLRIYGRCSDPAIRGEVNVTLFDPGDMEDAVQCLIAREPFAV